MRHVPEFVSFLIEHGGESVRASSRSTVSDGVELFVSRVHAKTLSELIEVFSHWLATSSAETIGDKARFARAPWVTMESPLGIVEINADTRREAVAYFAGRATAASSGVSVRVVTNQRGRGNKVVLDGGGGPPGWYAFLRRPHCRVRANEAVMSAEACIVQFPHPGLEHVPLDE